MRASFFFTAVAVAATVLGSGVAAPALAAAPLPQRTQLVSVTNAGVGSADRPTLNLSISGDGRFVAFESQGADLSSTPANGAHQIYLRDIELGTTEMVSSVGGVAGIDDSTAPAISANGEYVAFLTTAANLGSPRPTLREVVVWSRQTKEVRVVSVSNAGIPADGESTAVDISDDGTVVAFQSLARNLTSESTNGVSQVFVRDTGSGTTTMVSKVSLGAATGATLAALSPSISADGTKVALATASQMTTIPTGGQPQAFVVDRATGVVSLVSLSAGGTSAANGGVNDLALSGDGKVLTFSSMATDLTGVSLPARVLRVYSCTTEGTDCKLVSVDGRGRPGPGAYPSVSRTGRYITFSSNTAALVDGYGGAAYSAQVYVRDMATQTNSLVSVSETGNRPADIPNTLLDAESKSAIASDVLSVGYLSPAINLSPGASTAQLRAYVRNVTNPPVVQRIGGTDRYEASAAISTDIAFPRGGIVYLASGSSYPDALSSTTSAAAVTRGATPTPVLLTDGSHLSGAAAAELSRLQPRAIHVAGGVGTISDGVLAEVRALGFPTTVSRIAGSDRYDTSTRLSSFAYPGTAPVVYLASGENFADALAAGAAAGIEHGPILLTQAGTTPQVVLDEIARLAPSRIVVVGGPSSVSQSVVDRLGMLAPTTRVAGADRYAGSAAVSASVMPANSPTVYIASGEKFPDALSGSAAAAAKNASLLLVQSNSISDAVAAELRRLNPRKIVVLGGSSTVSDDVLNQLQAFLRAV